MALDEVILNLVIDKKYFQFEELPNLEFVSKMFQKSVFDCYRSINDLDLSKMGGFKYIRRDRGEKCSRRLTLILEKLKLRCYNLEKLRGYSSIASWLTESHVTLIKELLKWKSLELQHCRVGIHNLVNLLLYFGADLTTFKISHGTLDETCEGYPIGRYLGPIFRGMNRLQCLHLDSIYNGGDFLYFVQTDFLTDVNFTNCILAENLIPFLKRCQNLRRLDLSFNFSDKVGEFVANFGQRHRFYYGIGGYHDDMAGIGGPCRCVGGLETRGYGNMIKRNFSEHRSLEVLKCLPELKNLEELTLNGFNDKFSDQEMAEILPFCTSLKVLRMKMNRSATFFLMEILLEKLLKLEILDVDSIETNSPPLTDKNSMKIFWSKFHFLPNFQQLNNNFIDFSPEHVSALSNLKALNVLKLSDLSKNQPKNRSNLAKKIDKLIFLKGLHLNRLNYPAEGVAQVLETLGPRLESLYFSFRPIDTKEIEIIAEGLARHCPNLKTIKFLEIPKFSADVFLNQISTNQFLVENLRKIEFYEFAEMVTENCFLDFLRAAPNTKFFLSGEIPENLWKNPKFQQMKHKIYNFVVV